MSKFTQVLGNKTNPLYINDKPVDLKGNRAVLTTSKRNSWTEINLPMAHVGTFNTAIVFQDKIHIFGGDPGNDPDGYHYTYDGETFEDLSNNLPYINNVRYDPQGCSALVYNDELYIFGGGLCTSGSNVSNKAFLKYDGTTWYEIYTSGNYVKTKDKTPKSEKTYYTRSESEPGVYVYIEFTGSTFVSGVTYYEHKNVNKISLPYDFYVGSVALYNGEFHLLGGGKDKTRKTHKVFNFTTEKWTSSTSLGKPLRGFNNASLYINNVNINYIAAVYIYNSGNIPTLATYIGKYNTAKTPKWIWDSQHIGINANFIGFIGNNNTDYKKLQYTYKYANNDYRIAECNGSNSKDVYTGLPELDVASNVLYYKDEIIIITNKLYKTKELYDLTITAV